METWTVLGKGQTDFRPVFAHVEQLKEKGQLPEFQGLLYFTDGEGIFPSHAPTFETLFLLSEENKPVPEWAGGIFLDGEYTEN